jgi:hypothetical protein
MPNLDAALIIKHPGNTNPAATTDVRRCEDVFARQINTPVAKIVLPKEPTDCTAIIGTALFKLEKNIAQNARRRNTSATISAL